MARRRYSAREFSAAIADPAVATMADLCRELGIVPRGANYESLRRYATDLGIDLVEALPGTHGRRRREQPRLDDIVEVAAAVRASPTLAATIRSLGGTPSTGAYRKLRDVIERHGLDTSHMTGAGWALGRRFPSRDISVDELIGRTHVSSGRLRRKLIEQGYKAHMCEGCGRSQWRGRDIPLELDHIDGDRTNNALSNLRLLCPNCHALTPTYRGRNIGRH